MKIEDLYWYDKGIYELYLNLGSYKKVSIETGVPIYSIKKTVIEAIKKLK